MTRSNCIWVDFWNKQNARPPTFWSLSTDPHPTPSPSHKTSPHPIPGGHTVLKVLAYCGTHYLTKQLKLFLFYFTQNCLQNSIPLWCTEADISATNFGGLSGIILTYRQPNHRSLWLGGVLLSGPPCQPPLGVWRFEGDLGGQISRGELTCRLCPLEGGALDLLSCWPKLQDEAKSQGKRKAPAAAKAPFALGTFPLPPPTGTAPKFLLDWGEKIPIGEEEQYLSGCDSFYQT